MAQGQKPFYIVLGLVVAGGIAFIATRMFGVKNVSIPANVTVLASDTAGFHGYVLGAAAAPVEITEYADFECPACANFEAVQYPDVKVRLIDTGKARWRFRDFPLPIHPHSRDAAHAAACADEQGKFWDVKPVIFRRQDDWAFKSNPMPVFQEIMQEAGVDVPKWTDCMKSMKYAGRIQASVDEGTQVGVPSTPSFLVGGRIYPGANTDQLVKLVDSLTVAAGTTPAKPIGGQ